VDISSLSINLFLHLFNLQLRDVLVLRSQILNSFIDLFSCLNDHIIDIHIGLDAIRLFCLKLTFLQFLNLFQNVVLLVPFILFRLSHFFSLLFQVNDLNVCHQKFGIGLQVLNILHSLNQSILFISGKLDLHLLLILLQSDVLVQSTISLLQFSKLGCDIFASKSQSISLKLVNDVCVGFLLLNQHFLHFNTVLALHLSSSSGLTHWCHTD